MVLKKMVSLAPEKNEEEAGVMDISYLYIGFFVGTQIWQFVWYYHVLWGKVRDRKVSHIF